MGNKVGGRVYGNEEFKKFSIGFGFFINCIF